MKTNGKLMNMLTGYAASHRHPFNVFVHMIGIPTIMLGVLIPLTWVTFAVNDFQFSLGHVLVVALFLFYLTLDALFAVAFLVGGILLEMLASKLGGYPGNAGWIIAALLFFGGYAAQFIGHAVEKSNALPPRGHADRPVGRRPGGGAHGAGRGPGRAGPRRGGRGLR